MLKYDTHMASKSQGNAPSGREVICWSKIDEVEMCFEFNEASHLC